MKKSIPITADRRQILTRGSLREFFEASITRMQKGAALGESLCWQARPKRPGGLRSDNALAAAMLLMLFASVPIFSQIEFISSVNRGYELEGIKFLAADIHFFKDEADGFAGVVFVQLDDRHLVALNAIEVARFELAL